MGYSDEYTEDTCKKQYAEMQDGEIVAVHEYRYLGTVNVWTENGIVNSGLAEVTIVA